MPCLSSLSLVSWSGAVPWRRCFGPAAAAADPRLGAVEAGGLNVNKARLVFRSSHVQVYPACTLGGGVHPGQ